MIAHETAFDKWLKPSQRYKPLSLSLLKKKWKKCSNEGSEHPLEEISVKVTGPNDGGQGKAIEELKCYLMHKNRLDQPENIDKLLQQLKNIRLDDDTNANSSKWGWK